MHSPVLVSAPAMMPVSLSEAKLQLGIEDDATEQDTMIEGFIAAAVDHLDGWTGILGRALVEQTWRIDFDGFSDCFRIPLGPVISVTSLTVRNKAGQLSTVSSDDYTLLADALGPYVKFKSDFVRPSDLNETKPIALTFLAGYATTPEVPAEGATPAIPAVSTVPPAIKAAILIHVRLMYDAYRLGADAGPIPTGAIDALITPYRRVFF